MAGAFLLLLVLAAGFFLGAFFAGEEAFLAGEAGLAGDVFFLGVLGLVVLGLAAFPLGAFPLAAGFGLEADLRD